ncbi:MAG: hypothetical protein GY757_23720 [bacterium]|nr:hypothetical protein [bacterium]
MNTMILKLKDVHAGDVEIAGGKGANLGEMINHGFPIPPGFVIASTVCKAFFNHINLHEEIKELNTMSPLLHGKISINARKKILKAPFPRPLEKKLFETHASLQKKSAKELTYAVRSSATLEDHANTSFAGQHETYYYVTKSRLPEMIKCCWASLWNPEAVSYRTSRGIDHTSVFMAVVVQEMILSEVSGVTFTANPVTGSTDEIITESCWGMGAAIVDGRVTPDQYVLNRDGSLLEKRIAAKRFMNPPLPEDNRDIRFVEVPYKKRKQETLSIEMVRQITQFSLKSEAHFGTPQDVEWAITDGQLYLLQSRPITILGREEIGKDIKKKLVIFKPLLENFTEPLTPLTCDLLSREAPPGCTMVRGWGYIEIKYLRPILPFKITDEEVAKILYSFGPERPPMKVSVPRLILFFFIFFVGYLCIGTFFARTRKLPDDFMERFRELCREVEKDPAYDIKRSFARLWSWSWYRFFDPLASMPVLVNLTSLRYLKAMHMLRPLLHRWVPGIRKDAALVLCAGADGALSTAMGHCIKQLGITARSNKKVRELFTSHKPEALLTLLEAEPEAAGFLEQLQTFLDKYGHRTVKELELRSPRWEENPTPVLGMIRNFIPVEPADNTAKTEPGQVRSQLEKTIRQKLAEYPFEGITGLRWRLLRFLIGHCKYYIKLRENSRFYHVMSFTIIRRKILQKESQLLNQGKLKCKDDIFFLKHQEIKDLQSGELGWLDVEELIRNRRLEYIRLSKMVPPKTIGIKLSENLEAEVKCDEEEALLHGQPASPGLYEGVAHVILDPALDVNLNPGEILVAPYTDPAWTPLFLTAGAAIVEVGSFLSHAGTVAREFGMPCVVDLPGCLDVIHTGMRLQVDGERGTVKIINHDKKLNDI